MSITIWLSHFRELYLPLRGCLHLEVEAEERNLGISIHSSNGA